MFLCPKCGASVWGTDMTRNVGTCHGQVTVPVTNGIGFRPCDFTWSREDDAKYGIFPSTCSSAIGQVA